TTSSPALSGSSTGRLAFSVFEDGGHSIYVLDPAKVVTTVAKEATGNGASLTGRDETKGDVERMLADSARGLPPSGTQAPSTPYTRKLTLDFLSQPTISASVGQFGTY